MTKKPSKESATHTRRDFLSLTAAAMAAAGAAGVAWPVVSSMNPSADVMALATKEVDLSSVLVGQSITVMWQGKPIFIRRRTQDEIEQARQVALTDLPDPQSDKDRVQQEEWLVLVGICTHLGCVPVGQKSSDVKGEYGGWFCPCHGSHYDTSGRIRKGPAPKNLMVPPYEFTQPNMILIG